MKWTCGFPAEMAGEWFRDDPEWYLTDALQGAETYAEKCADELEEERERAKELEKELKDAEEALKALQDEVRVYLAHLGDPEAIERLKGALDE